MLIVHVCNDGTGGALANYTYEVFINRTKIGSGEVVGHDRKDGWPTLLELVAQAARVD